MRAVNLLPREEAKRSLKPTLPVLTGVAAAVLATTVVSAGFLLESAKVAHQRSELDAARAELALVPPPAPQQASSSVLAGEETQRVAALQSALDERVAWDRVLREVSLVLPNDVWLSGLSLTSPTSTAASGTESMSFSMSGSAFSHADVARLLSRLALVPDLANVELDHSNSTTPGKHSPVEFKVTADVRVSGVGS